MKIFQLFSFLLLLLITKSWQQSYKITKACLGLPSLSNDNTIQLGTLRIFQQGEISQAYIDTNENTFVSPHELAQCHLIIIFTNEKTRKQYRTTINKNIQGQQMGTEKIIVLMSTNNQVIGINYVQNAKKASNKAKGEIQIEIVQPQKSVEHVFKVETQQKQPVQQQSFFSKYKWPLIIGGVLLYMTMNADPGKAQAGQNAAQ